MRSLASMSFALEHPGNANQVTEARLALFQDRLAQFKQSLAENDRATRDEKIKAIAEPNTVRAYEQATGASKSQLWTAVRNSAVNNLKATITQLDGSFHTAFLKIITTLHDLRRDAINALVEFAQDKSLINKSELEIKSSSQELIEKLNTSVARTLALSN